MSRLVGIVQILANLCITLFIDKLPPVKSFEKAMAELRDIIDKLEDGNLPLEESIKLFQKGTKLIGYSHKKLNEIAKKVEILIRDSAGDLKLEEFAPEE